MSHDLLVQMIHCDCLEYKVLPSFKRMKNAKVVPRMRFWASLMPTMQKYELRKQKKRSNLFTYAQDEGKFPLRNNNKLPKTKRSNIFKLDSSLFGSTNVA